MGFVERELTKIQSAIGAPQDDFHGQAPRRLSRRLLRQARQCYSSA
jgi:hypothetical protein